MPEAPPPTLRLTVDTQALADNWRSLDRMSGSASAGAAVKADCYGLGVGTCVPLLRDAGCRNYFVAHWSEVEEVLQHIEPTQLAVLHGPASDADVRYARATNVRPVIDSLPQAKRWIDAGGGLCDLMVDTGINRLGLSLHEIGDPLVAQLEIDTLMSHLACADDDSPMNAVQLARFKEVVAAIPARRASLANSAGIALGEDYCFDLTRPGLSLYGGVPRAELKDAIRQVAFPQAAVIQLRNIAAGDTVGYNATFTAPAAMRVGVVSLGYADGFLRSWNGAHLVKDGAKLPILGKVSMDMVVVDLANAPDTAEGDWLDVPYDLPYAAQQTGLSQYELLTILGRRIRNL